MANASAEIPAKPTITHIIFDMDGLLIAVNCCGFSSAMVIDLKIAPTKCTWKCRGRSWMIDLSFCLALQNVVYVVSASDQEEVGIGLWLWDTENFYSLVQEKILARYGKQFDWSLKAKMMGKKAIEAAEVFVNEMGLNGLLTAAEFLEEREGMLQSMFPTCELMPEVKRGKPSPDIFLAASRRFEDTINPNKILVFEDAPAGVAAAKNAGMSAVMVPDPRLDRSYHEGADQVLSSLLDFDPSYWGLPPFQDATAA
ncbi:glutathione synthase [Asimina triloba]